MSSEKTYYIISSLRSMLFQMAFTVTSIYYILYVNLNPLQVVLVGTILEATVFICEIPTGYVADCKSRKLSVCLGFAIIGVAFVMQAALPSFIFIAISQIFWGLGWTFISGAESAWIADETKKLKLDDVFMNGAKYMSICSFLGIVMSMILSLILSIKITLLLSGLFLIILSIWASFNMKEKNFIPLKLDKSKLTGNFLITVKKSIKLILADKILVQMVIITLIFGLSSEGFDRLWEMHLLNGFKLSEKESIYIVGALSAIVFLINILLIKSMEKNIKNNKLLFVINSILICTIIIFALSKNFVLAASMLIVSNSLKSINYSIFNIIINEQLEARGRATMLSMFGQLDSIGQITGGPLIGLISYHFGTSVGICFTGLFLFPIVMLKVYKPMSHRD